MRIIKDIDVIKIGVGISAILLGLFGLINGYVSVLITLSTFSLVITPSKKRKGMF